MSCPRYLMVGAIHELPPKKRRGGSRTAHKFVGAGLASAQKCFNGKAIHELPSKKLNKTCLFQKV